MLTVSNSIFYSSSRFSFGVFLKRINTLKDIFQRSVIILSIPLSPSPPLSVLHHEEIQQTQVRLQPSDFLFEELLTYHSDQSDAETGASTFT